MGSETGIEWTDSTWNPTTGCTKVSRGCDHCYAERVANRLQAKNYTRRLPVAGGGDPGDPFAVRTWPGRLSKPEDWQQPRRIFVDSMSDLHHKALPDGFVEEVYRRMLEVDRHVYQVLTKRPARMAAFLRERPHLLDDEGLLPGHIWLGTSVEDQEVDYRLRHLASAPARRRFVSCEPLLGSLELGVLARGNVPDILDEIPFPGDREFGRVLHWIIVGGESGDGARPMDTDWARALRDECRAAGVPLFVKQMGEAWAARHGASDRHGGDPEDWPEDLRMRQFPPSMTAHLEAA